MPKIWTEFKTEKCVLSFFFIMSEFLHVSNSFPSVGSIIEFLLTCFVVSHMFLLELFHIFFHLSAYPLLVTFIILWQFNCCLLVWVIIYYNMWILFLVSTTTILYMSCLSWHRALVSTLLTMCPWEKMSYK